MADARRARATTIAAVLAIAAPAEGIYHVAYRDPPGILTVCEGHTGDVDPHHYYSDGECFALAQTDAGKAVDQVEACVPQAPESVVIAFGDAVFNMGPTIACNRQASTAARLLATRQWRLACEQLPRWDKARVAGVMVALPGLTKRRAVERSVCLKDVT